MGTGVHDFERARQTVEWFVGKYEPSYRLLAQYGAMPLLLTPELLNYLRNRFLRGRDVPWVAEVDLLLSELYRPVDYELYVMQPAVRAYLLAEFKQTAAPGELARVARILIHYVRHLARSNAFLDDRTLQAQQWAAMVYLDEQRPEAVRQIAASFAAATGAAARAVPAPDYVDRAELQRLTRLTETLAPELGQHGELLDYAALIGQLLAGEATQSPAEQRAYEANVAGVALRVPEALITEPAGATAASAAPTPPVPSPHDRYLTVTLRIDLRGEALAISLETPTDTFADSLPVDLGELADLRSGLAMERTPEIMARLSDGLFSGAAGELFQRGQRQAKAADQGLRLAIQSEETGDAPWEMLYAGGYLAVAERSSVVRYHPNAQARAPSALPESLGILIVDASAGGPITKMSTAPNMAGRQRRELEEALGSLVEAGLVTLDYADSQALAEPEGLAARAEDWSVIHYLAAPPQPDGETPHGNLRDLEALLAALGAAGPQLVVLEAVTPDWVVDRDVAELLARTGLPTLVRFRRLLLNEARPRFAGAFYAGLARGTTVEEAMTEARRELYFENAKRDSWSLPVLHLTGLAGQALVLEQDEQPATQEDSQPTSETSPIDFEWITIPEGDFLMGSERETDSSAYDDETPQHTVYLPAYRIARYPVTNEQYQAFVDAAGYETPSHWENGRIPDGKEDHPVVNVSWHDAQAFCKWAGVLRCQARRSGRRPPGTRMGAPIPGVRRRPRRSCATLIVTKAARRR